MIYQIIVGISENVMAFNPRVFAEVHKVKLLNDLKRILQELQRDHDFWCTYDFDQQIEAAIKFAMMEIEQLSRE